MEKLKFFTQTEEASELRAEFLELCKKLHPDKGGDIEQFKAMKNEFEAILGGKVFSKAETAEGWKSHFNADTEAEFIEIIERLIFLPIDIEICGCWIWLHNTLKEQKEVFKELGFKWAPKKKLWFHNGGKKCFSRGKAMDEIRENYGSTFVKNQGRFIAV